MFFYGCNHPDNLSEPTKGEVQNSYSAELFALLLAVERTTTPIHYVADNFSVISQAETFAEIHNSDVAADRWTDYSCAWMWIRVVKRIKEKPKGYFLFTWQKAHVKETYPHLIEDGIYSQREADWNDEADKLAGAASEQHKGVSLITKAASERSVLAQIVHSMYLEFWEERL